MAQNKPKATIVRGPDGKLYTLTKAGLSGPLNQTETQQVNDIVEATKKKLEAIVVQEMAQVAAGCTQRVHITIPDVDM